VGQGLKERLKVSGLEFNVSGFGFKDNAFGFRVQGGLRLGFRV
jgi:hypothetical protein